jgi:hypothetical protein
MLPRYVIILYRYGPRVEQQFPINTAIKEIDAKVASCAPIFGGSPYYVVKAHSHERLLKQQIILKTHPLRRN